MAEETVTSTFTYYVGDEEKKTSTQVRAWRKDIESEEAWRDMAFWAVLQAIADAESDLILETPEGRFVSENRRGYTGKTESIGPIQLILWDYNVLIQDPDKYELHRVLE